MGKEVEDCEGMECVCVQGLTLRILIVTDSQKEEVRDSKRM